MAGNIQQRFGSIFRDWALDKVPASGPNEPSKAEIRAGFGFIDTALSDATLALAIGNPAVFPTRAAMNADLAHPNQRPAIVFNDPTPANNSIYLKNGDSGTGFWGITSIALSGAFAGDLNALGEEVATTQSALTDFQLTAPTQTVDGSYVSISDSSVQPNAGLAYAVYSLSPSQRYRVVTTWRGGDVAAVNFFADSVTVPNRKGNDLPGQNMDVYFQYGQAILTMPTDANLLVVNHNIGTKVFVLAERLVTDVAERSTPVPAVTTGLGSARGKVLVLGTSIDAARSTDAASSALGLAINNQALGGGMYRSGFYANQQATGDDIYGFQGVDWNAATGSFTMDDSVRAQMIADWSSKWAPNVTNSPPPTLSPDTQARINGAGYSTRLDPFIDAALGTYQPGFDTFYIGAPFNDWNNVPGGDAAKNADMLVVNPSDDFDRTTVFGALNWVIRRIFQKLAERKIHARPGLMGHYECQRASGIREVQEMVAAKWSIPLYPLYDRLGVSTVPITVSGTPTTLYAQELPDGIHPHSDPAGRIQFGKARHDVIFLRDWLV